MRYFKDVTDNEREELTDEQVTAYVTLECARQGVPLLPKETPTPPTPVDVQPDSVVYEVGSFCFVSRGEAETLVAMLTSAVVVDLGYGANYTERVVGDRADPPSVNPRRVYSRQHYETVKGLIAARDAAQKAYDAAKKDYDATIKARDAAAGWIWKAIETARENKRQRQRLRDMFEQYVALAEGNRHIAWGFLEKANPSLAFPELREEFFPPEMAAKEA